ncbi:unnamed protein product [Discula destructiva]
MPDSTPASGEGSRATPEVQKYRPRACQSCARSKMRCVWPSEPGATPCQRCAKIKASCTLPEINPRRRRGPSTRVGQLEEKIDGIMSLLNASQQIQQNSPDSGGQTPPSSAAGGGPHFEQSRNSIHQLLNPNVEAAADAAGNRTTEGSEAEPTPPSSSSFQAQARSLPSAGLVRPASIAAGGNSLRSTESPSFAPERDTRPSAADESVEIVKGFRVSFYEADRALNLFRSIYSPYYPFVTIPVMMTSSELFDTTPFLFRTVVAITTPQLPAIQAEYKMWFREYVAQHVVVNGERRLEILQAILIHLAWGDFNFMVDSQATNLIQLAIALVIDLGLNRWPLDYGKASLLMLKEATSAASLRTNSWRRYHTLDEMRAALGTFYTTSLYSTLFRRHPPMIFNPYLLKCCNTLAEADEYDSDKFLAALVRIQQLINRAADIIPYGEDGTARRVQYTPIHMALTAAHKELETLVRQQPPEVQCNTLLWTHYHGTICRLFEPVIYIRPAPLGGYGPQEGTSRTGALWTALNSARDFFAAFLAIPPQNHPSIPFHCAHLSFCAVTIARLLFLGSDDGSGTDPDWNAAVARDAVGFEALLIRVAQLFEDADRICGAGAGPGRRARYFDLDRTVLAAYRDKARWIRDWYVARTTGTGAARFPQQQAYYREAGEAANGGGGRAKEQQRQQQTASNNTMDSDYNNRIQQPEVGGRLPPAEVLDEGFWQAMFDWSWNGPMDFQLNELQV